MREILFRGKRMDNGKWIEGNLFIPDSKKANWEICFGTPIVRITYDVNPKTIGQFTGLTDKNGKKIFEGDVVQYDGIMGIINYSMGCYCVKINKPDWRGRNNPAIDIVMDDYPNEMMVIGNIHDNPELCDPQR